MYGKLQNTIFSLMNIIFKITILKTAKENFIPNANANYYILDEYSKEHTNMLTLPGQQNRT